MVGLFQSQGLLTSSNVKAFLCDGTNYFGYVLDSTAGGGSFTTNSSGQGPGDSTSWTSANHFGGISLRGNPAPDFAEGIWTGRGYSSNALWNNTSFSTTRSGWTSLSSTGQMGDTYETDRNRYSHGGENCTSDTDTI